jgi:hypothetical protein
LITIRNSSRQNKNGENRAADIVEAVDDDGGDGKNAATACAQPLTSILDSLILGKIAMISDSVFCILFAVAPAEVEFPITPPAIFLAIYIFVLVFFFFSELIVVYNLLQIEYKCLDAHETGATHLLPVFPPWKAVLMS